MCNECGAAVTRAVRVLLISSHERAEKGKLDGALSERGAQGEQNAGGAARQVHGEAQELLAGEGEAVPVREGMPPQAADVASHDGIPTPCALSQTPTEVEDHACPTVEDPGLDIEQ